MHWIEKLHPPIIFGHRGASIYAPENTTVAFELALQQGAEAFELDTMLSADGIPVVIHDSTVDRTTDGSGKVDQISTKKLRTMDAGSTFSSKYSDERIPLLEEIFTTFKNRALINVELKNYHNPSDTLPEKVVEIVNRIGVLDQLLFSSFIPSNLKRIKQLIPDAQVALLCAGGVLGYLLRSRVFLSVSPNHIHPHFKDISKSFIDKQHHMNRKVNTWTVNHQTDMIELINQGIDGIITDDPKLAQKIKQGMKK
jgi:glycerophosphoryl diester phosphodiesterase